MSNEVPSEIDQRPVEPGSASVPKKTKGRRLWRYLIAAVLIVALVYFADYRQVVAAFRQMTPGTVAYLMLISVLLVYVSALKWHYFLESFGASVPVLRLTALYLVGYFINLIVPSYVGGDAVRSWYVGKNFGQREAITATIMERYTGMLAMVTLACIFVWFSSVSTIQIEVAVVLIALALAAATFVALSSRTMSGLEKIPKLQPVVKNLRKIQEGLRFVSRDKWLLTKALALSFLYHSFTVVNTVAAGYVVGWYNPPLGQLFVVLPLILLCGALPITPSGLGIQEGAFFYFLTSVGATPAQAIGVAVVLRAKSYVLALAGGVCWFFERRK